MFKSKVMDRPARAVRLGAVASSGFTATVIHGGAGPHVSHPWPEHRLLVQTSLAPNRARCVFDGQAAVRLDQRGDFCLQPATLPGLWENGSPVELVELRVAPQLLKTTAEGLEMGRADTELAPHLWARDGQVEHIAMGLKGELESGAPSARVYVESLALALATRLLRQFGPTPARPRHGLSRRQLRHVVDHVEAHLHQDLPLADLAAAAGVSVPHFTVLFRRSTGVSAHRYVMAQRVSRARTLILAGRLSITQVALETGFAHGSHLARCMRKVLGLSPGDVARCR